MEKKFRPIQQYLDALAATLSFTVHVADPANRIVASTSPARIGEALTGQDMSWELALKVNPPCILRLVLEGGPTNCADTAGAIKAAMETILQTLDVSKKQDHSQEEHIIRKLFFRGYPENDSTFSGYLKRTGMDLSQSRTVILLDFSEKVNRYFNINLNLGYEASAEELKEHVIDVIKSNRYLTRQDIVAQLNNNQIIIIKAFLQVLDKSKVYQALDLICNSILKELESSKIFSLRMAYGNFYTDFPKLKLSYEEAKSLINIGASFLNRNGLYVIDDLLVEQITRALSPMAGDKILQPILSALKRKDGTSDVELLHVAEIFVDEGFNLVRTSQKTFLHRNTIAAKIEKVRALTGLDPERCFHDALLIKLAAVYVRLAHM